jgi:hypothetical protein
MAYRFHKHKLLLDENMSSRLKFPRLNGLFDVKHVRDDLNKSGLPDKEVYALAVALKRLIVTVLDPKSWTQSYVNIVNRLVAGPFVVSAIAVQTQRE